MMGQEYRSSDDNRKNRRITAFKLFWNNRILIQLFWIYQKCEWRDEMIVIMQFQFSEEVKCEKKIAKFYWRSQMWEENRKIG